MGEMGFAMEKQTRQCRSRVAVSYLIQSYREVLHKDWGELGEVERAKRPQRLPVVLTRGEVDRVLIGMSGTHQLMAKLLYGTGIRLIGMIGVRKMGSEI